MEKEAGRGAERRARDIHPSSPTEEPQGEEQEEEEEEPAPEEQAGDEQYPVRMDGMGGDGKGRTPNREPWEKPQEEQKREQSPHKPRIVGLKLQKTQEDIVDLDSFVNQHYKAKARRAASMSSVLRQRSLQKQDDTEDFRFERGWRVKRDLGSQEQNLGVGVGIEPYPRPQNKHWMSLLSVGFSKLDVSLCVLLYVLSSMCLLAMYLYFKLKVKLRRAKVSLP